MCHRFWARIAATVEESTPPDMATAMVSCMGMFLLLRLDVRPVKKTAIEASCPFCRLKARDSVSGQGSGRYGRKSPQIFNRLGNDLQDAIDVGVGRGFQ